MPKIMIVDDSASTRDIIRECLESHGFTDLIEAEDGQDALEYFKKNIDISFVITDCHMPIIDGFVMCETIYKMKNGNPPPILILTTESNAGIKERYKKLGVVGWILKPFDKERMGPVLAGLINKLCPAKGKEP